MFHQIMLSHPHTFACIIESLSKLSVRMLCLIQVNFFTIIFVITYHISQRSLTMILNININVRFPQFRPLHCNVLHLPSLPQSFLSWLASSWQCPKCDRCLACCFVRRAGFSSFSLLLSSPSSIKKGERKPISDAHRNQPPFNGASRLCPMGPYLNDVC